MSAILLGNLRRMPSSLAWGPVTRSASRAAIRSSTSAGAACAAARARRAASASARASSGRKTSRSPVSASSRRPDSARGERSILTNSSRTRSRATLRNTGSVGGMAARVAGSSVKPSTAAKRTARRARKPSSEKRSCASRTQRMTWAWRSVWPPNGSTRSRLIGIVGHRVDGEVPAREVLGDVASRTSRCWGGGRRGSRPRCGRW